MSTYFIKFTDNEKIPIEVGENSVDNTSTDISLFGRKKLMYGQDMNANLLHILENFACSEDSTNPGNPDLSETSEIGSTTKKLLQTPIQGQLWFNKTQSTMFSWDGTSWNAISNKGDLAVAWGVICDGEQLPKPVNSNGYVFDYDECIWIVSPRTRNEQFDYMVCSTDANAVVTMIYGVPNSEATAKGLVNYMIVGIRGNTNIGEYIDVGVPEVPPTPTPSASAGATPTPSASAGVTPTPTRSPTPTPAAGVTPTPTRSPTPTPTSTAAVTPTPTPVASPTSTPIVTASPTPTITITPTPVVVVGMPQTTFEDGQIYAPGTGQTNIIVYLVFKADGTYDVSDIANPNGNWMEPPTPALSSQYEIRLATPVLTGNGTRFPTDTYNSWINMGLSPSFGAESVGNTTVHSLIFSAAYEIRHASTLSIVDSGTIQITSTADQS